MAPTNKAITGGAWASRPRHRDGEATGALQMRLQRVTTIRLIAKPMEIMPPKAAGNNKLYNCGFTGPRWGEGADGHRAYCLSEKIAQDRRGEISNWPQPEISARGEAIEQCKAKHSKKQIQFCNSYAIQAVANAKTFKEKNCDPSQNGWGRWERDYDHHFTWCIGPLELHDRHRKSREFRNRDSQRGGCLHAVAPPKSAVIRWRQEEDACCCACQQFERRFLVEKIR